MASTPLYLQIRDRIREDYALGAEPSAVQRLPTERELQERYGVSRPTIAKALAALASEGEVVGTRGHGRYFMARGTVLRPNGSARRIGYVASIATEVLTQHVLFGVEREAARRGYRVLMANANNLPEQEAHAVADLIASGVSGLVIYPVPRPDRADFRDYLNAEDLGVPVVLVDTGLPSHPHPQFVFDNELLGNEVATWLLQQGCRRLVYLVGDEGIIHRPLQDRVRGVRRAVTEAGLQTDALTIVRYSSERLEEVARALLQADPRPDAVIATEDRAAGELVRMFADGGLRVGTDVFVVGFDSLVDQRLYPYPWATTRPHFDRLGERACAKLLDMVEGAPRERATYVYEVTFVTRRSSEGRFRVPSAFATLHPQGARE